VALIGLLAAGCAPGGDAPPASSGPPAPSVTTPAESAEREADLGAVDLRTGDEAELAAAIRSHQGSMVLVDFWATWCLPCVELFPHTVALDRNFGDRGLVVIGVSFDLPESEPEVRRFLAEKGATFQNFLSPYGVSPKAFEAFEIPGGALPCVRIYDRDGQVRKTFGAGDTFSPEDIDRAVQQLLEQ
jgi:thiol-disulfide isomerase/thioredoxin